MQPDNSSVIVVAFKLKPKFYLEMKTVAEILKTTKANFSPTLEDASAMSNTQTLA